MKFSGLGRYTLTFTCVFRMIDSNLQSIAIISSFPLRGSPFLFIRSLRLLPSGPQDIETFHCLSYMDIKTLPRMRAGGDGIVILIQHVQNTDFQIPPVRLHDPRAGVRPIFLIRATKPPSDSYIWRNVPKKGRKLR